MGAEMQSRDEMMCTYDGKQVAITEWWADQEKIRRDRRMAQPYEPFIEPGDLVFDIGANKGVITILFRWLGARVVAVDPLYTAAPQFVRAFGWKFGEDSDVIPVAKAISDHVGEIALHVHRNLPSYSTVDDTYRTRGAHARYFNAENCSVVRVPTTTLDALIAKYGEPVFIKIDVEGHEEAVVRGLTVPVRALNFEFHQDRLRQALRVIQHLDSLADYEYTYSMSQGFYEHEWVAGAELLMHLRATLKEAGYGSWGNCYARRKDVRWTP